MECHKRRTSNVYHTQYNVARTDLRVLIVAISLPTVATVAVSSIQCYPVIVGQVEITCHSEV